MGGLVYLVDTNVWLEMLLEQEKAEEVRRFFAGTDSDQLAISDFSLYSIAIILTRMKKDEVFRDFLLDVVEESAMVVIRLDPTGLHQILDVRRSRRLDFDDAYQYVAAERGDLTLISFDSDFDSTPIGRKTPGGIVP